MSKQTPLQAELVRYFSLMSAASSNGTDTLQFWADSQSVLPILSRIAARILPTMASSTDVERMFSCSGRVNSPERASLTRDHINMLTIMRFWYTHQNQSKSKLDQASKNTARADRFARLHAASQGGMVEYNIVEGSMYNENSDGEEEIEEEED